MSRQDDQTPVVEGADDRALGQTILHFVKLGWPLGTLVCAVVGGLARGAPAVVLVLAGGALVAVIAVFWASLRTLVGETPLSGADAYAIGAVRAEEEQKRAVLRALKDLEFERSVGKISEDDYAVLVAKYRAEAKRLLRAIDADTKPQRDRVERLVAERLIAEGLLESPRTRDSEESTAGKDQRFEPVQRKRSGALPGQPQADTARRHACSSCGTKNDADARFCKKCGQRQDVADGHDELNAHQDEEAAS